MFIRLVTVANYPATLDKEPISNKTWTVTSSRVCSDYILIFREWKRLIDRLTEKILLDGLMDR